jgi:hypothetical protein
MTLANAPLRGTPDYGIGQYQAASQTVDTGELANRILRIAPLTGTGRLVYYDDFSQGLSGWIASSTGGDPLPSIRTLLPDSVDGNQPVYVPPNCAVFIDSSAGTQTIRRQVNIGACSKIGIEISVCSTSVNGFYALWSATYTHGNSDYTGSIQFNTASAQPTLISPSGDLILARMDSGWNNFKFVMDISRGYYGSAFAGATAYDASSKLLATAGNSKREGSLNLTFVNTYNVTRRNTAVGLVIVTRDEP